MIRRESLKIILISPGRIFWQPSNTLPNLLDLKKLTFLWSDMSKFLIDENLSPLIAVHLRRSGYKARAVRELRLTGKSDEVILNFAQKNRFIIVTGDVEFGKFFYERYGTLTIIILR